MDMSLSKFQELVKDREAWLAASMEWQRVRQAEGLNNNNNIKTQIQAQSRDGGFQRVFLGCAFCPLGLSLLQLQWS